MASEEQSTTVAESANLFDIDNYTRCSDSMDGGRFMLAAVVVHTPCNLHVKHECRLTCAAVVPEDEACYAQDEDGCDHDEGEDEAYGRQEGNVLWLSLELGVLIDLDWAHHEPRKTLEQKVHLSTGGREGRWSSAHQGIIRRRQENPGPNMERTEELNLRETLSMDIGAGSYRQGVSVHCILGSQSLWSVSLIGLPILDAILPGEHVSGLPPVQPDQLSGPSGSN
ncbi:hypothetical protein NUW54_g2037 [Trametes sanguinea]|uniref:Uncharacterized protein n=1 Tax=Trametes sanguinea TaxID=158606 RepID=A0ACC1Q6G7_9APHY|nr:hypothetical protein NUW54_g2037 [Trametes sanguinea]